MSALLEMRKRKNMTQSELASIIGADQPAISRYENGEHSMTLNTAYKIAKALGCKVDDLIDK